MKIALVHDYLAQDGGAERVLKAFSEIWPEAPIFVLFHDKKKISYFQSNKIRQSFLAHLPLGKKLFQWYLPLMPMATERHNLHEFNVVLSSTSAFAKGVLTRPETLHISYCHTPPRYLWTDTHEYLNEINYNIIIKIFLHRTIHKLRLWDKLSVDRVDHFIANSRTVQQRISKYYRRDSDIIYPPIDTAQFNADKQAARDYFVAGGRIVPYKRLDIVVRAFNRLKKNLKIFGSGVELKRLKKIARPNIEFMGQINEQEKIKLLSAARAFIHPQIEDFGITPLESMSAGRPVIAYASGGAVETVIPNETGLFFNHQSWECLYKTILNFEKMNWDNAAIREQAKKFDLTHFKQTIKKYVDERYEEFQKGFKQAELNI